MIDLSRTEMIEILKKVLEIGDRQSLTGVASNFDAIPLLMQAQMIGGATGLIQAMQELGYRIARPLKDVSEG